MKQRLIELLQKINGKRIMVVGDIMLDKYVWGEVSRISPEAPVQVVNVGRETFVPGGAANVANNLSALGATVFMVGVAGEDGAKNILMEEFAKRRINSTGIIIDSALPTIQKVRIIARNQQLLRVDYETPGDVPAQHQERIISFVENNISHIDAVAISDYAKGTITAAVAQKIITLARTHQKPVIVDPKPQHKLFYKHATIITPNHFEAHKMSDISAETNDDIEIEKMGTVLLKELQSTILITRGEKGMSLFEKNKKPKHIPTYAQEVYDIAGAGDTVVAALTGALASGATFEEGAHLANFAAGIVVRKVGTATATSDEIIASITHKKFE